MFLLTLLLGVFWVFFFFFWRNVETRAHLFTSDESDFNVHLHPSFHIHHIETGLTKIACESMEGKPIDI